MDAANSQPATRKERNDMRKQKSKAPKPRVGHFVVTIPVYGLGILLSFGQTKEQLEATLKKRNVTTIKIRDDHGTGNLGGYVQTDQSTTAVLWLRHWPERASQYNVLQHEIFHAVDYLLRNIGFTLSDDSNEAWAYAIGHVSEKVYQFLWDKKYHK